MGLDDGNDNNDFLSPAAQTLIQSIVVLLVFIGIGTLFYTLSEDLPFVDGLYMSVITVTTVGYGDYSPQTPGGRVFGAFWILCGVLAVARALGDIVDIFLEARKKRKEAELLNKKLSLADLLEGAGQDGKLDFHEFVVLKLQAMGKIDKSLIVEFSQTFTEMDRDGTGEIDAQDILDYNSTKRTPKLGPNKSPKLTPARNDLDGSAEQVTPGGEHSPWYTMDGKATGGSGTKKKRDLHDRARGGAHSKGMNKNKKK